MAQVQRVDAGAEGRTAGHRRPVGRRQGTSGARVQRRRDQTARAGSVPEH